MKILLISPGTTDEIDNLIIRGIPYLGAKAFNAPHAVATVAALTPPEHQVTLYDEFMKGPVDQWLAGTDFDIIGISVTSNQLARSLEIAGQCRLHCPTALVVAGGIGVETLLNHRKAAFDVVFSGEAEETWPAFLNDYQAGKHEPLYRSLSKPDLTKLPPPRWELIREDLTSYNSVSIQTTRGCPFDCSFCDVIYVYGRKPRSKSIPQVLEEVKRLSEMGIRMIFLADDNFAGDREYAREMAREFIRLNRSLKAPMGYFTQLDLGVAADEELLQLLADANFYTLMIGIESISEDSLQDLNKKQNLGISIQGAIEKIQSYGMVVLTHMIIGADSDDRDVFERTAAFINEANIVFHICHPLAAPPGTRLWYDLKRKGRIVHMLKEGINDQFDILSNIIPAKMSRQELFTGLAGYWETIYEPDLFVQRAVKFLEGIRYYPRIPSSPAGPALRMTLRFLKYGYTKTNAEDRKVFKKLLRFAMRKPARYLPRIIYLYSYYLIDRRRSAYDARMAREHAKWESENPGQIVVDHSSIPVSEKIRASGRAIVHEAYRLIRPRSADKEHLCKMVLQAVSDFNDRFGSSMDQFDPYHREQLHACCERAAEGSVVQSGDSEMPESPPSGFTREIIDALDSAVRYRESAKTERA